MYPPFALFLVVLLSVLAGCGSSSSGGVAQTVTAVQSGDFLSYLPGPKTSFAHDNGWSVSAAYLSMTSLYPDVVQRDGDQLYIASEEAGLTLVDVSSPDAMQVLGRYPALAGVPLQLYVQDGWLAAVTSSEIVVLDVTDPGNIRPLRSLDLSGLCVSSRLDGPRLYLSCIQFKPYGVAKVHSIDLRDLRVIDEFVFEFASGSGFSKALFGEHRIYLATYDELGEDGIRLHAIDISDPAGKLVDVGHLRIPGFRTSWIDLQMDEYRDVVRVVSKNGNASVVATFTLGPSGSLQPLRTEIFPPPGSGASLARVLFNGPTAYLALDGGEDRSSALVTVDLTDPSQPVLAGLLELESPSRIEQLDLRDDRLFVAGENEGPGSSVALIDVSDPSVPNLLDRFEFDGDMRAGRMTLDDQGRVLRVPIILDFSGHGCPEYLGLGRINDGGVQLIGLDPSRERLEPGAVLLGGWTSASRLLDLVAERPLVLGGKWESAPQFLDLDAEHLLVVDGNLVQSLLFDGYALHRQNTVALADSVVGALPLANGTIARFASSDVSPLPSTRFGPQAYQAYVDFAPAAAAGDPDGALGSLQLYDCSVSFEAELPEEELQVFARGDQLESLYRIWDGHIGLRIIDVSDPVRPRQVSDTRWESRTFLSNQSIYGGPASLVVRTDHAIVMREGSALRVIDLSNPAAPVSTMVNLPGAFGYGGLLTEGDEVLTSHHEVWDGDDSTGRFYLDRISLAPGEPPVVERPVNIPGELLYKDRESGDLLTRELVRVAAADYEGEECPGRAYTYPEGTPGQPWAAECVIERLNLVSVADGVATLRGSVTVDPAAGELRELAAGDGVVFALQSRDERRVRIADLMALTGFGSGQLAVERALLPFSPVSRRGYDSVPVDDVPALYARGKRVLVLVENSVERILALGTEAGRLDQFSVNRLDEGFPSSVAFDEEGRALLALGRKGVKWVDTDLDSATTVSVVQALIDYVDDIVSTIE